MNQQYENLIRAFGGALGHPELVPDEDGACALTVDGEATLFVQLRDEDTLLLFAEVGRLPTESAARELLAANLFGQGTAGGSLGLVAETDMVVFNRSEPLRGLDHTDFAAIMEVFIDLLGHWRKVLPTLGAAAQAAPAASDLAAGMRV